MALMLEGKVSIVTGASSGIGRAIALSFANQGAVVVAADIDEVGGRETVAMIERQKGRAIFVRCDLGSATDNEAVVAEAVGKFGALHIAINNAGIAGPSAPTGEYPVDGWDKVIAVNLSGVFYGMRYQIPAMLNAGGGAIVNIASILGQVGFANAPAYVAAKHGVVGLTQNAAIEYGPRKIRINSIGPGFIQTPMIEKALSEEARSALVGLHPIGRLGRPEEVAELALWLASERASFVTGAYYAVDGGYLAR